MPQTTRVPHLRALRQVRRTRPSTFASRMPSNALTTNLVRRHVVLDTLTTTLLDDETLDDTVGGLDGRDHPLAAATAAVAGGGASPSTPVGRRRLPLVRQHVVRAHRHVLVVLGDDARGGRSGATTRTAGAAGGTCGGGGRELGGGGGGEVAAEAAGGGGGSDSWRRRTRSRCTGALEVLVNGPPSVRPWCPVGHEALPLHAPAESRPRVEIYPLFPLRRELRDRLVVCRCRWSQSLHAPNRAASRSPWHPWRCCCGSFGRIYTRHEAPHLIKLRRTAAVARCVLTSMHAKLAEVRSYEHRWYHGREAKKTSCAMCSSAPVRPGARVPRPRRGVCAPGVAKFATQKISKIVPGELSLRSGTARLPSYFWRRTRSRSHWRPTIRNSSTRHSACVEKTWLTCVASSNRTSLEM